MTRGSASVIQSSKGVFLSYASEDAEVAKRICDALRKAGIDVWFDQSELRGGDAWDQKIRQQIRDCVLFVPIISTHTQTRPEGYFRLEWKLAVDRSHLMAAEKAFLVPVVVDTTTEAEALVPTQFRDVQWTRVQAGQVPPAFVEHIAALLNQPLAPHVGSPERAVSRAPAPRLPIVFTALSVAAVVALVIATEMRSGRLSQKPVSKVEASTVSAPVATNPAAIPEKSVAVLPFVDMSEKKDQEYFSDGLSEELIDMLAKIPELRVPARTSSFYFKGKSEDVPTIAKRLLVAHVLEGSVRKSGNRLRVTAQLIRADNGYHLWSETYDRTLDDIFKIQDEIAESVVKALKASLSEKAPQGPRTRNADAYQLYLQGRAISSHAKTKADIERSQAYLHKAMRTDPGFADPWVELVYTLRQQIDQGYATREAVSGELHRALSQLNKLAPNEAQTHEAIAEVHLINWDWLASLAEVEKACELDPRNARNLRHLAESTWLLSNEPDKALSLFRKAIELDPVSASSYRSLYALLFSTGRLLEAEDAARHALDLDPTSPGARVDLGMIFLRRSDLQQALAEVQRESSDPDRRQGLAIVYWAMDRLREASDALAQAESLDANDNSYGIASVYAFRGDKDQAFAWLDRAYRQRELALMLSNHDFLLQKLHGDSRFAALLRALKLHD